LLNSGEKDKFKDVKLSIFTAFVATTAQNLLKSV
jgi:hypothetical protein